MGQRRGGTGVRILELSLTPGKYGSSIITSRTFSCTVLYCTVLYGIGTRRINRSALVTRLSESVSQSTLFKATSQSVSQSVCVRE